MKKLVIMLAILASLVSFTVAGSADKIDINMVDLSTLSDAQLMTLRFRIDEKLGTKKLSVAFSLDEMSYWQLVNLKDQINLAMWQSQEWQEVTVPQGVWKVGEDIPAGHWTIKAKSANTSVKYGTKLDEVGKDVSYTSNEYYYSGLMHNPDAVMSFDPDYDISQIDLMAKDGRYIVIDGGSVIFTPYTGKPSLGFK